MWRALKAAGWIPPLPFVQMKHADLVAELEKFQEEHGQVLVLAVPEPAAETPDEPLPTYQPDRAPEWVDPTFADDEPAQTSTDFIPRSNHPDPAELPGQRVNTKDLEDIIRIDDKGRAWLQEEVQKPAFPKPRGRRVLRYNEQGTTTETIQVGEYTESFEIAGEGPGRPAEIKITLPSFQVGIYRDSRFPFKVICYNGSEGFDRMDIEEYYGGAQLVPAEVKRIYVSNVLCYDVRSVVQSIQTEFRQQQLTGRVQ
jgi:hypothetical protein